MKNPAIVSRLQSGADLAGDRQSGGGVERAGAPNAVLQRFAGEQVHGEEQDFVAVAALDGEKVAHPADIHVRDLPRTLYLDAKAPDDFRLRGQIRPDGLDGDGLRRELVESLVDFSHSSPADQTDHFEAIEQYFARVEGFFLTEPLERRGRAEQRTVEQRAAGRCVVVIGEE